MVDGPWMIASKRKLAVQLRRSERLRELRSWIDGDVFYQVNRWPHAFQRLWRLSDFPNGSYRDKFPIWAFLIGNGLDHSLASEWMSLQFDPQGRKGLQRALDALLYNPRDSWTYWDIHDSRSMPLRAHRYLRRHIGARDSNLRWSNQRNIPLYNRWRPDSPENSEDELWADEVWV